MPHRIEIEVKPAFPDARGEATRQAMASHLGITVDSVATRAIYTFDLALSDAELETVRENLTDPVVERSAAGRLEAEAFDWMILVGFKPGVTDNVGRTTRSVLPAILGRALEAGASVHTSTAYILGGGGLSREQAEHVARDLLANTLIESTEVIGWDEWQAGKPELHVPKFTDTVEPHTARIDLGGSDDDLKRISAEGTLSLTLGEMQAIRDYFNAEGAKEGRTALGLDARPTDVELEMLAQTWSEHCKHKIFSGDVEYTDENGETKTIHSLFKTFIRGTTEEVAKKVDWLVSVFHDNAGIVDFNDRINLVYKVETHNSPSALEPYGGAMTGIVGCNRDPLGTGLGAELLTNVWGYCFADPFDKTEYPEGVLHPRRIRDGVHRGVVDGGNQSGIPYGVGWEFFDERYSSKPMVYCGTLGVIPKEIKGRKTEEKFIDPGDVVVMAGGRIGKDGIHGATFSSEELHGQSPSQAVQIGDPITQKKMSDFLLEARDAGLYNFVTDNGAGGLSSSVGEMATACGGVEVDLALAPLKYPGLMPWEIWLSEAQERMSFAVPPENLEAMKELARRRDVELTVLGNFRGDGYITLRYGEEVVARIGMDFLHDGCPKLYMRGEWKAPQWAEPALPAPGQNLTGDLEAMMQRLNVASKEYKWRQYDHEVKGRTVVKPMVGVDRDVPSPASVFLAEYGGREGYVLARGFNSHYSDVDTYHMTAMIIDESVRRIIAVGGRHDYVAGMDNFCWPDPVESASTPDGAYKMAQLVRCNQALYDYCVAFNIPLISGKDSMKNDSTRGGKKVSVPPSLLFSVLGKVEDIGRTVTLVPKAAGDAIYVVGATRAELGGSEYAFMLAERDGNDAIGKRVPQVDIETAKTTYAAMAGAIEKGLVRSAHVPTLGGLGVALSEMAFASQLGIEADLGSLAVEGELNDAERLFSESGTRFVVTVAPESAEAFEKAMAGVMISCIGEVSAAPRLNIVGASGEKAIDADVAELKALWRGVFAGV